MGKGRTRTLAALAAAIVLVLPPAGCGDEENAPGAPPGVPAAGPYTPPSGTPGVPEGASYDVDGKHWLKLTQAQQFEAAGDFIDDNPSRCEDVDIGAVVDYTTDSYGYDFPPDIEASEVLAEACDASRQS
jgi:hypothetical protein